MNAVTEPPPMDLTPATNDAPSDSEPVDLTRLVDRHQAAIWRYLRYLGARPAEADDLTQEVFLAITRKGFEQQSEAKTAAYLRTVARNALISLRRKGRREVSLPDFDAAEAVWQERGADRWDDQIDAIRDCVGTLEGRAKQAIDLQYRDKAGREAIANELGMTADGVKSLLRRTRAVLRDCVERTLRAAT